MCLSVLLCYCLIMRKSVIFSHLFYFFMEAYLSRIEARKVEEQSEILSYRINHIDPSVLNAIRRTIISDVPTVAIHWVYIRENETVMADEILSHRLGLIPIIADAEDFERVVKTPELDPFTELTDKNSIQMKLVITNNTDKILTVRSNDIKILSKTNAAIKQNVIITRLVPGKKIECRLFAIIGTGREHSKWMPTSVCYYRTIKKLEMKDPSKAAEIQKYFRDGFSVRNGQAIVDEDKLLVNMDIEKKYPNEIKIHTENDSFLFEIEGITASPKTILKKGIRIIKDKLKELKMATDNK
ncbi:DNA-directed RNA polymerases I and III subunit RPAC1 [Nematocida sp. AWRm79]|nr:DNA-directed RNA polymerases I and III subunit RPAC1 [Nematocida sp. AWRm79]